MSKINETEKTAPDAYVLRILSGVHAGASRKLAAQEMILVGSGDDCDIVLADAGVARHHALINLGADVSSLRALDAPLKLDDQPVQPGDPVALRPLQRIRLGETAIAFGLEDDAGWETLLPGFSAGHKAPGARPSLRRLPMFAALAVLSLASLAIFAAVMPVSIKHADPQAELAKLKSEFQISDGHIETSADGTPVLTGTVKDEATLQRMQARLDAGSVEAGLALRTGEKIAADVREVLRTAPTPVEAKTRYLGGGRVEVTGHFTPAEMESLQQIVHSRSMDDVAGVTKLVPNDLNRMLDESGFADGRPSPSAAPVTARIVSVVRGKDAHLVGIDGTVYKTGDQLEGIGRLSVIGTKVQAIDPKGLLHEVKVTPVTAAELALAAEEKAQQNVTARTTAELAALVAGSQTAGAAPTTAVKPASDGKPTSGQTTPASDDGKVVAEVKPGKTGKSM